MDLLKLKDKFPLEEIEWRIGMCGVIQDTKIWALVLAYIDNRAIQNRLDDVCGQFLWKNEFVNWKDGAQLCGISIYNSDLKEWVTKWDGADNSDIEGTKGGLSDSMKRAAYQWGIGRYLYGLPQTFAKTSKTKIDGWAKQPKSRKSESFYWQKPTLPNWALPNKNTEKKEDLPPPPPAKTEDPKAKKEYHKDKNGVVRYNKTDNTLNDRYQTEHGFVITEQLKNIHELVKYNLGGNFDQFYNWLFDVYEVVFWDIKQNMIAGIMQTLSNDSKTIMDHKKGR